MTMVDSLTKEFGHEAATTRRLLERLPDDKLTWRPHAKSFTASGLASHIVDCVDWADSILNADELDFDPATYKPFEATSVTELLDTFDTKVAHCNQLLARTANEAMTQPWRMKVRGRLRLEKPRVDVFRDFILSHVIHHRGQLSVYLRLLDVPVPGSYGPSADEMS